MTYAAFLAACRQIASKKLGRELSQAEFGRLCGKNEHYYSNMESGTKAPGRLLMEAAAKQAGFTFESCIRIPVEAPPTTDRDHAMEIFKAALSDWREARAKDSALVLATMKKPKKPKTGGRPGKKQ